MSWILCHLIVTNYIIWISWTRIDIGAGLLYLSRTLSVTYWLIRMCHFAACLKISMCAMVCHDIDAWLNCLLRSLLSKCHELSLIELSRTVSSEYHVMNSYQYWHWTRLYVTNSIIHILTHGLRTLLRSYSTNCILATLSAVRMAQRHELSVISSSRTVSLSCTYRGF